MSNSIYTESEHARLSVAGLDQDFIIYGDAIDKSVYGCIKQTQTYEPYVMSALQRIIKADFVCFDIGGNIGVISVVMGRLAKSGRVFSFEPSEKNAEYFRKNCSANQVNNIELQSLALGDVNKTVEFCFVEEAAGCSFIPGNDFKPGVIQQVKQIRLDDFVAEKGINKIDFVKMDVEGAEIDVINGGRVSFEKFKPTLLIEFNPVSMGAYRGIPGISLFNLLKEIWGDVSVIDDSTSELIKIEEYDQLEAMCSGAKKWQDLVCNFV